MILHNLTLCALFTMVLINGLYFKTRIFFVHDCAYPLVPLTAFALCFVYLFLRARAGSLHAAELSPARRWLMPALDIAYAVTLTLATITLVVYSPWSIAICLVFIILVLAICPPRLFASKDRNVPDYTRTKWFLFGMLLPVLFFYFQFENSNLLRDETSLVASQGKEIFANLRTAIEGYKAQTGELPETLLGGSQGKVDVEGQKLVDPFFELTGGSTPSAYSKGFPRPERVRHIREFVDDANILEWICLGGDAPRLDHRKNVFFNVGISLEEHLGRFNRINFPPAVKHPFPQQFFYRALDRDGDGRADWALLGVFGSVKDPGDTRFDLFGRNGEFEVEFTEGDPVFVSADGRPDGLMYVATFELNL